MLNQSLKSVNYNPKSVWINKIPKRFLSVAVTLVVLSYSPRTEEQFWLAYLDSRSSLYISMAPPPSVPWLRPLSLPDSAPLASRSSFFPWLRLTRSVSRLSGFSWSLSRSKQLGRCILCWCLPLNKKKISFRTNNFCLTSENLFVLASMIIFLVSMETCPWYFYWK